MMDEYSIMLQQAKKDIAEFVQPSSALTRSGHKKIKTLSEGIWAYDIENNRVYWSDNLFALLGMPKQDSPMTIEEFVEKIYPEDRFSFEQIIQVSLSTSEPFDAIISILHSSGYYVAFRLIGKIHQGEQRQSRRISGQMIQVTELQQAQNSLLQAHKELADIRYVLNEATVLSVTDRQGIITYANDALCQICQYSYEELIGQTFEIMKSSQYPQSFLKEIWDLIRTGQIWRGEIKHLAKDGTYFWMDTTIVPLLDSRGTPFQYIVVRHDITQQKSSEQEIRELKSSLNQQVLNRTAELENINIAQKLEINKQNWEITVQKEVEMELKQSLKREKLTKHLIQLMNRSFDPSIILEIIVQELGVFFNVDRCLVLYEKEEEEKKLQFFAQYYRSDDIQPVQEEDIPWQEWRELSKNPLTKEHPLVILNASKPTDFPVGIKSYLEHHQVQSAFAIEIKFRGVIFGRLVLHQCGYSRVWTEQEIGFLEILATHIGAALYQTKLYQQEKQAKQEAKEANHQKSKILSYVSHDFKNPLASMKRFIDMLEADQSDVLSDKHRELIGYIAEGVYQLRSMVMDILDKARLEEGKIIPRPQWIALHSFLDELKPMFNSMASQRNIDVSIDIESGLTAIKVDSTHLRQILINLVSNAVKYNRINGKVFLSFYKSENKQFIVIEVQDNGLGIPEEKIPKLFTDYFRADLSQSNSIEGTGLGLAFIKKLIELQEGNITVESQIGVGSTFKVSLPFLPAIT